MGLTTIPKKTAEMPLAASFSNGIPPFSQFLPREMMLDKTDMNSYRLGMKSTVSERGQVTIPKRIREQLGIRPGQVLEFQAENGRLVAKKELPADPVEGVFGIIKLPGGTDQAIAALRGEAEGS